MLTEQSIQLKPEEVFKKLYPYSNKSVLRIGKHKYNFQKGLLQACYKFQV